jgi:hypothetical protein
MGYKSIPFEGRLLVSFQTKIPFTLLAELVETGPRRVQIFVSSPFHRDEVKITMEMSSLMKSGTIDHKLCICEYGLRK